MSRTLPQPIPPGPEGFETFYKDVRDRLLLQTYALTGDPHAAQHAVRDALVIAWHHWRKVARLERPEDYVRPLAWSRAQRRGSARWWARRKDLDKGSRATLSALGKLPRLQRKVLLLAHLSALPMDAIAREVGVTRATAERELQTATARFAVGRDIESTAIRTVLTELAAPLENMRWPRPSILMRAGAARRRVHTGVGVGLAVGVVLVSGSLVTDAAGSRPELAEKPIVDETTSAPPTTSAPASAAPEPLTAEALLDVAALTGAWPGDWAENATTTNAEGDGIVFTCQASRYADPRGRGALVRTFSGTSPKAHPLSAGQSTEASATPKAAERTYKTTVGWYAACATPRVQLLSTHTVTGVGDEATVMVLRDWSAPVTTSIVAVARTGGLTTTVVNSREGKPASAKVPDVTPSARLLANAVNRLCTLPDGGTCASTPNVKASAPFPIGRHRSLLVESDLPPVPTVDQPWAGTQPVKVTDNLAATRCDKTRFDGPEFEKAQTRTFVIPAADLPPEFGLSETVGVLAPGKGRPFVTKIREQLAACPSSELGTDVELLANEESGPRDLSVWRLTVEVSENQSVRFLMAVVRERNAVAQLTFVPAAGLSIGVDPFIQVARRAQERLSHLVTAP